ncbi:hypothetical protein [Cardiobacterium sp. Marseille-Q4385]|uniref:hypothetical protein n=1 Tax=Cardiobacterium sp. Marseille-Q4385 TaxID=2866573 RepID=UPI001CE4170C|nr:hypothetical protein [Cardiobacterium sp. Marseille-Q4385]
MTTVNTVEELREALKNGEETIEIEGKLAKKTIQLRSIGAIAWTIYYASCVLDCYLVLTMALIAPTPARIIMLVVSSVIGGISLVVAGGDIYTLIKMRAYEEISRTENTLLLEKK